MLVKIQENKDWNWRRDATLFSRFPVLKSKKTRIEMVLRWFRPAQICRWNPRKQGLKWAFRKHRRGRNCMLKSKKTRIESLSDRLSTPSRLSVEIQENKDWNSLFSSSVWQRNSSWNPRKQGLKFSLPSSAFPPPFVKIQENKDWNSPTSVWHQQNSLAVKIQENKDWN